MMRLQSTHILGMKVLTHILCLAYVVINYYWGFTDQLGADPVKSLIHKMGLSSLNLLLLTLVISPASRILKQGALIHLRRMLGLYCFFFALLHLSTYLMFDLQLDWGNLLEDIVERPYITVGFTAFVIFLILAVTSPMFVRKQLKSQWQKLHNTVYLAAALVILHFIWSVKSDLTEPLIYLVLLVFLFYLRRDQAKHWIKKQIKDLT